MAEQAKAFIKETLNGRYQLVEHLNDGYFSHVFKALDRQRASFVALKILKADAALNPRSRIEFQREGDLLKELNHCQNVVKLLDSFTSSTKPDPRGSPTQDEFSFHVLELADKTLSELAAHPNEVDWLERLRLFRHVASGVHQMHLNGIVHRDLKASNVLLFHTEEEPPIAKVADLGRSCKISETRSLTPSDYAAGRGDKNHAPPEHFWLLGSSESHALRMADIFLLGSVLYEIATGESITENLAEEWVSLSSSVRAQSFEKRQLDYRMATKRLINLLEKALELLTDKVPSKIRELVVAFLRQMCHPVVERREPSFGDGTNSPERGLQWVICQTETIMERLESDY